MRTTSALILSAALFLGAGLVGARAQGPAPKEIPADVAKAFDKR
jgi:hypothetical protein